MTFGTFAKRQLFFEPEINQLFTIAKSKPSFSAVLRNMRIRYIISDDFNSDFTCQLFICSPLDPDEVLESSNILTLSDFTKPTAKKYRQGFIRFDFSNNKTLAINNRYPIRMQFNCASFVTSDTKFIMFALDYPFRTYNTGTGDDPFTNGYIEHQVFLEGDYDDFVVY